MCLEFQLECFGIDEKFMAHKNRDFICTDVSHLARPKKECTFKFLESNPIKRMHYSLLNTQIEFSTNTL